MAFQDISESRMYRRAEEVADEAWSIVIKWAPFAQDTVGKQLARAADSIGANIAESAGRFHPGDVIRFLYYGRGSLNETRYWLRRALARDLIPQALAAKLTGELDSLAIEINSYVKFQKTRSCQGNRRRIQPRLGHRPANNRTNELAN